MNILSYTFEEYFERVQSFHGFAAPGVVIGGFMVDLAYQHLPEDRLFDAICETAKCLPDAIQLLTSCTVANGAGCEKLYGIWQTFGRFTDSIKQSVFGKMLIGEVNHKPTDHYARGGKAMKGLDPLKIFFEGIRKNVHGSLS